MGSRQVNIVLPTTATPNDQDLSRLTLLNHLLYARVGIDFHREEVVETVHFGGFLAELLGKGIGQVVCWVGGLWALTRVGVKRGLLRERAEDNGNVSGLASSIPQPQVIVADSDVHPSPCATNPEPTVRIPGPHRPIIRTGGS
jgi:hypothetical protein